MTCVKELIIHVPPHRGRFDVVGHKQAPLNVSLFAWRLHRNRLSTKDNLLRRRVLHMDDTACMGGYDSLETAEHLLFGCDIFGNVWFAVLK